MLVTVLTAAALSSVQALFYWTRAHLRDRFNLTGRMLNTGLGQLSTGDHPDLCYPTVTER